MPDLTCSVSVHTHRVPVHVAPDSSCNLTGEQDDEAGEELQDGPETQQVSASILLPELRLRTRAGNRAGNRAAAAFIITFLL